MLNLLVEVIWLLNVMIDVLGGWDGMSGDMAEEIRLACAAERLSRLESTIRKHDEWCGCHAFKFKHNPSG